MHQHITVVWLELDDAAGFIQKVGEPDVSAHLPVGIPFIKNVIDRAAMNGGTTALSPQNRSGIREALQALHITNTKMLLTRSCGLSLSDQYWVRPEGSNLNWDDINFFQNSFFDDIGDVLFGRPEKAADFDFSSPDNTSNGHLKKRWKIIDGRRCLIKAGSNPFQQQPFNEVIASRIMDRLDIPHVPYAILWNNGVPYCVCEDFITPDTELVSARRIMQIQKKEDSTSVYRHNINCCKALGVKDIVPALDQMIVLDFIIANEDRHLNNFGLIRNAKTLEWLGAAPIYDSGTSLGYDMLANQISADRDITCKPFKKHHIEQLKLVSSFGWIDFDM